MNGPARALLFLSLLLIPALLVAGCNAPRATSEDAAGEETARPRFERRIAPFEVRNAEGEPYAFPFLGGLNVPRPQLVDIDGDGDFDLFLQEESGAVMFFENTGTPTAPAFTWRADRYRGLDVGEWYRFADFDQDGTVDLLAEEPYSYIRYYHNAGTPSAPNFVLAADTLKDVGGTPIFSDRQNIPNIIDIDCNGRIDLFLGRLDGTVTRYEEVRGESEGNVPRFRLVAEEFEGIEIIGRYSQPGAAPLPPRPGRGPRGPAAGAASGPSLHGANTMAFADVDGDGDYDLLWGDFFEPGLLLIENTGSCPTPVLRNEPVPFPSPDPLVTSGYNAPTVADLNGDGRLDLLVGVIGGAFNPSQTAQNNLYYYEQTAPGRYALQTRRFLDGIDVGSESIPALADLDGDGDLDLLLANKIASDDTQTGRVFFFENQGTPEAPSYQLADTLDLEPAYHYAPAFGDLDGDGNLDLLLGTWNDGIAFYRNEGTPSEPAFVAEDLSFIELTRGSHATPALVDIDGDGDLDLFVGEASGTINFYRNTGTPEAPRFELVSDAYEGINVGRRSAPAFADLDGDGNLDLVVGSEDEGLVAFRNTGTRQEPAFERDAALALSTGAPELATPAFADLDGDGAVELFTGSGSGGVEYYENLRP